MHQVVIKDEHAPPFRRHVVMALPVTPPPGEESGYPALELVVQVQLDRDVRRFPRSRAALRASDVPQVLVGGEEVTGTVP